MTATGAVSINVRSCADVCSSADSRVRRSEKISQTREKVKTINNVAAATTTQMSTPSWICCTAIAIGIKSVLAPSTLSRLLVMRSSEPELISRAEGWTLAAAHNANRRSQPALPMLCAP